MTLRADPNAMAPTGGGMRYDVLPDGMGTGRLQRNLRGCAARPSRDGRRPDLPECGTSTFRREIAALDRETLAMRANGA